MALPAAGVKMPGIASAEATRSSTGRLARDSLPSVMDLKGRVALIAGSTGPLGTAIARALAGAGADIAITASAKRG